MNQSLQLPRALCQRLARLRNSLVFVRIAQAAVILLDFEFAIFVAETEQQSGGINRVVVVNFLGDIAVDITQSNQHGVWEGFCDRYGIDA